MSSFLGSVNVQNNRPVNKEKEFDIPIEKLMSYGRNAQMIAAAVLVSSVALLLLGLTLTARGSFMAGVPLLILSVPSCYLVYNGYQICTNLKEILVRAVDDMKKSRPAGTKIDKEKFEQEFKQELKRNLSKGTVGFKWFIDRCMQKIEDNS